MSVATELRAPVKPGLEPRKILGPAGNGARVAEEPKRKKEGAVKKAEKPKRLVAQVPAGVVQGNVSLDSVCSLDSCSSGGSCGKSVDDKRRVRHNGSKSAKVVPNGGVGALLPSSVLAPVKRCDWITPNSDARYTAFHDEEWGVPVHDDRRLFQLLILSQALAEHTWPTILSKIDAFSKLFENFDPSSIAKFSEKKILSLRANGSTLLSEPKLRAIVDNANHLLKVQQEFGSFSKYCWHFIYQKPIRNGFRYARQVPAKTPKSELISKDLMQRGFCCVGPTVFYSFMQVAGMTNDHLVTCFRYNECNNYVRKDLEPRLEERDSPANSSENTSQSHD
ncbi:hypothetical protein RJ639_039569 [Escallonia herrerae]|uniref:DNA-3-methyladenine glycosylase I n=1 Tax=Escallonia herrerae TaxID=1293975 RepID=A0AA89B5R2_9ASTE|nr:hypothetical protein RJ639_039569 [Escallonia herrerae]